MIAPNGTRDFQEDGPHSNLADLAIGRQLRAGRGPATALVFQGKSFTYDDLAQATLLFQQKILSVARTGDHVAIMMPDCPAFAGAFLGAVAAGTIASPVNPRLAPADVSSLLKRMRPSTILITPDFASTLGCTLDQFDGHVLVIDDEFPSTAMKAWDPSCLVGSGADNAYCLFSSGTTGQPKGVIHDHRAPLACMQAFESGVIPMQPSDRILAAPKLTFGYGLLGNLLFGLLSGASSILLREPYGLELFVRTIERDQPTMLLSQPRVLAEMIEYKVEPRSIGSVKVCLSAGEKLGPALYREWVSKYKIPLLDVVGSTELGHIFIGNRPGYEKPGSAGRILPGFEARIVKEDGAEADSNERGELLARGVGMTRLYCNDAERTVDLASRGWVRTGDMFSRSEDGFYTMHGRVDDLIKVGCGQWITPTEMEDIFAREPEVVESAVVGRANSDGAIEARAYIVSLGGNIDERLTWRLNSALKERWPGEPHKHIDDFQFIKKIPRSLNGKIDRVALRTREDDPTDSRFRLSISGNRGR